MPTKSTPLPQFGIVPSLKCGGRRPPSCHVSFTGGNSIAVKNDVLAFLTAPLIGDFSPAILVVALAFIVGAFILNRTRLGRYAFAMGSDERSTIQAGVPVDRYKLRMFAFFGVMVGFAMLITVSRLGAAGAVRRAGIRTACAIGNYSSRAWAGSLAGY